MGNTGRSRGPHLHYGVIYRNRPVNPVNYFSRDTEAEDFNKSACRLLLYDSITMATQSSSLTQNGTATHGDSGLRSCSPEGKAARSESIPSLGLGGARDDESYQLGAPFCRGVISNMQCSRLVEGLAMTDKQLVTPPDDEGALLRNIRRQQAEATQQIRAEAKVLGPAVGNIIKGVAMKGYEVVARMVGEFFTRFHEPPTFYGTRMIEEQPDFSIALSPQAVAEMRKQKVLVAPRASAPTYGIIANLLSFVPVVGLAIIAQRAMRGHQDKVLRGALVLTTLGMNASHLAVHGQLAAAQMAAAAVLARKKSPLWFELAIAGVVNLGTLVYRWAGSSEQELHLALHYGRELEAGKSSILNNVFYYSVLSYIKIPFIHLNTYEFTISV